MNQEQLDRATGEIAKILTPYRKHAGERAANIVMALQGCDTVTEMRDVVYAVMHWDAAGPYPDAVSDVVCAWLSIAQPES